MYCAGLGRIEVSHLIRGVTPACSLYKQTSLAFFAHSSVLSEHMTSSLTGGKEKLLGTQKKFYLLVIN